MYNDWPTLPKETISDKGKTLKISTDEVTYVEGDLAAVRSSERLFKKACLLGSVPTTEIQRVDPILCAISTRSR